MTAYLMTEKLTKQRKAVDVLIENKLTFASDSAHLSIYDTYKNAQKIIKARINKMGLTSRDSINIKNSFEKKISHFANQKFLLYYMDKRSKIHLLTFFCMNEYF